MLKEIVISAIIFTSASICYKIYSMIGESAEMKIGKDLYITVSDNEIIDSTYLKNVFNFDIESTGKRLSDIEELTNLGSLRLWNSAEFEKMINYMDDNNFMILPGTYTINQTYKFKDGLFEIGNGKQCEIFKFQTK